MIQLIDELEVFFRVDGQAKVFAFKVGWGGHSLQMKRIGVVMEVGGDMLPVSGLAGFFRDLFEGGQFGDFTAGPQRNGVGAKSIICVFLGMLQDKGSHERGVNEGIVATDADDMFRLTKVSRQDEALKNIFFRA